MKSLIESLQISLNESKYDELEKVSLIISKDIEKELGVSIPVSDRNIVQKDNISISPDYSRGGTFSVDYSSKSLVGIAIMKETIGIHLWDKDVTPQDGGNLFLMVDMKDNSFKTNNSNDKHSKWIDYEVGKDNEMLLKTKSGSKKLYDMFVKIANIFAKHLK